MTRTQIILGMLTMILCFSGCTEKDDLTLPVNVDFRIGITENTFKNDYLTFTGGETGIHRISFDGKREAGEDVYFETDPRVNFPTATFSSPLETASLSDFDIPQGIYNYMKWEIDLKAISVDVLIDDDDDDFDSDYPDTGLTLTGFYTSLSGVSIPFIIAIDVAEQLNVRSYDADGNSTIVLSVDKDYEAVMSLDPAYAFGSISRESLEEADISDDSGTDIMIISSEENEDLYEVLSYRIAQSVKVIVK